MYQRFLILLLALVVLMLLACAPVARAQIQARPIERAIACPDIERAASLSAKFAHSEEYGWMSFAIEHGRARVHFLRDHAYKAGICLYDEDIPVTEWRPIVYNGRMLFVATYLEPVFLPNGNMPLRAMPLYLFMVHSNPPDFYNPTVVERPVHIREPFLAAR